jgi:peptidoglycan-N-acetylglucosamine deacetylase
MSKSARSQPIFADPHGWRAKATNIALSTAVIAFFIIFAVLFFGVVTGSHISIPAPQLTELNSSTKLTGSFATPPAEQPLKVAGGRQVPDGMTNALRLAFLDDDDEQSGSLPSLKEHAHELDGIVPAWLQLVSESGSVNLRHYERQSVVVDLVRDYSFGLMIFPEITSALTQDQLLALFTNPVRRGEVINQIVSYLRQNDFPGVVVNITSFATGGYRQMTFFLNELSSKLKNADRKILLRVPVDTEVQQLREMSAMTDYIIAATENENGTRPGETLGAAAAQAWFEDRLRSVVSAVPPSKLIATIGSYAFDIDTIGISKTIPIQQAWDLLSRAIDEPKFDGRTLNPTFAYKDELGHRHQVWLLDATTAFNQAKSAFSLKPAGIAIWRLGLEDPLIWSSIGRGRLPDREALQKLEKPKAGYGSYGGSQGALLAGQPGSDGERSIFYDSNLGLITDANLIRVPRQVKQTLWPPKDPMAVALTFDDGPDPKYTDKILDILAAKNVKATFYVIGRVAADSPEIVKRMYAEGHDIGNHTFSHPNPIGLSAVRLATELNTTARIVESITGVHLRLFRPPYAGPQFGYLDADPNLVQRATALGYVIGELGVESCDWCGMSKEWIVRDVMNGVVNKHSRVVLMHDAGGNREPTIDALPMVIDSLRAAGFRFVTTHELVDLSRDAVMPSVRSNDILNQAQGGVWRGAIAVVSTMGNLIKPMAIVTAAAGILRLTFIVFAAMIQARRRRIPAEEPYDGTFAILVPAYNEREIICKTVSSILSSTVADRIQVVVVDDGSSDGTSDVVRAEFAYDPRVVVLCKENGGKSAALNYGIEHTHTDVIVAIDGDTILLPDAVEKLIAHFKDSRVGAVAGNVVVGNRNNLLTRFQALEYVTSQNLDRRAFELVRAVGVVPGAIGAWRRAALLQAGGCSNDTLAEDSDLTFAIQRHGWRVVSEPNAVALTEAPETLRAFMKQRFRWMFGNLQVAYKHLGALRDRPGGISLVAIPNSVVFQFIFSLLAPVMDMLLFITLFFAVSSALFGTSAPDSVLTVLAAYWLLFQAIDLSAALVGIALEPRRDYWQLMPLVILQRFTYRQLLYVAAVRALLAAIKGTFVGWGKLVRTGNVALVTTRTR